MMETTVGDRRRWFQSELDRRCAAGVAARADCPCCGYPTLPEHGAFELCVLCDWENDFQDDADADEVLGGPNGDESLTDARRRFEQYRRSPASGTPLRRIDGGQDTLAEHVVKRALIATFDAIMSEADHHRRDALWQQVLVHETELHRARDEQLRQLNKMTQTGTLPAACVNPSTSTCHMDQWRH